MFFRYCDDCNTELCDPNTYPIGNVITTCKCVIELCPTDLTLKGALLLFVTIFKIKIQDALNLTGVITCMQLLSSIFFYD